MAFKKMYNIFIIFLETKPMFLSTISVCISLSAINEVGVCRSAFGLLGVSLRVFVHLSS